MFFSSKLLGSRIQGENVQKSEQIFGYFLGPCLVYMVYAGIAGTYLTQFYTDVLGIAGGFLTMVPLSTRNTKQRDSLAMLTSTGTAMLAGIQLFGYVAPTAANQVVVQPEKVRVFFNWCFTGFPMIGFAVCAVIMYFYRLES